MQTINKGYKQTEVGIIPDDWEIIAMSKISKTEGGYAFKSSSFLSVGIYQIIKMSNVYGGSLDLKRSQSFINYLDPTEEYYLLRENEILITLTGTVGKKDYGYTYLIKSEKNLLLNQRVARITINKSINPDYVFYQIRMPVFINQFFEASKGGTGNQSNVGTKDIDNILIPLPSTLKEQTAIATALSDVDALITSLERLIAKKRNIKQGAMQQLLKPKKGWEMKRLGDIANVNMGQSPLSEFYNDKKIGLPLIQGNADINNRKTIIRYYTSLVTKKGKAGDLIMSVRAPVGEIAKATFDCCLGRGVCAISYSNEYLYHYLIFFERSWAKVSTGSTFDSVNSKQVKDLLIPIPKSNDEQVEIATILSSMDSELSTLETKLEKYRQIKSGMMQNLLTGKIRLV